MLDRSIADRSFTRQMIVALLVVNSNEDRLHISFTELTSFILAFIVMQLFSVSFQELVKGNCVEGLSAFKLILSKTRPYFAYQELGMITDHIFHSAFFRF